MFDCLVLLTLSLIFYVFFGYPLVVLLLGMLFRRPIHKAPIRPKVALMIAAYNEEKGIAQKLEQSLRLDYPRELLRIIVVSDGSTDRTDDIVRSFSSQGVELIRVEGRVGKTEARNQALAQVNEEVVVFSDATTEYEPCIIQFLVEGFADPAVGMVTAQLIYRRDGQSQMGFGQRLFWKYESLIKKAQTNLGTLTGSVGCATAFRRAFYTPLPANIIEDFTEPLMFIQKGFRVCYEERALCFESPTPKSKNEWNMRVRVIRGGMTGLLHAKGVLNPLRFPLASFQLISHKILRWLTPILGMALFIFSVLAFLAGTAGLWVQGLLLCQLVFYALAVVSFLAEKVHLNLGPLSIPHYFILLNLASLVAMTKVMTSQLEATWETDR